MTAEVVHRSVQVPATTPTYQTVSGYSEAVFLYLLSVACRQFVAARRSPLAARAWPRFWPMMLSFLGYFEDPMLHPCRRYPHGTQRQPLCVRLPEPLEALAIYVLDNDKKLLSPGRYPRLVLAVTWHRRGGAKLALQQGRDRRAQLVPVSWTPGYRRFWNRTVKCGSASSRANSSAR